MVNTIDRVYHDNTIFDHLRKMHIFTYTIMVTCRVIVNKVNVFFILDTSLSIYCEKHYFKIFLKNKDLFLF